MRVQGYGGGDDGGRIQPGVDKGCLVVRHQLPLPFLLHRGDGGHPGHRFGRSRIPPGGVETPAPNAEQESRDISGVAETSGIEKNENIRHRQN